MPHRLIKANKTDTLVVDRLLITSDENPHTTRTLYWHRWNKQQLNDLKLAINIARAEYARSRKQPPTVPPPHTPGGTSAAVAANRKNRLPSKKLTFDLRGRVRNNDKGRSTVNPDSPETTHKRRNSSHRTPKKSPPHQKTKFEKNNAKPNPFSNTIPVTRVIQQRLSPPVVPPRRSKRCWGPPVSRNECTKGAQVFVLLNDNNTWCKGVIKNDATTPGQTVTIGFPGEASVIQLSTPYEVQSRLRFQYQKIDLRKQNENRLNLNRRQKQWNERYRKSGVDETKADSTVAQTPPRVPRYFLVIHGATKQNPPTDAPIPPTYSAHDSAWLNTLIDRSNAEKLFLGQDFIGPKSIADGLLLVQFTNPATRVAAYLASTRCDKYFDLSKNEKVVVTATDAISQARFVAHQKRSPGETFLEKTHTFILSSVLQVLLTENIGRFDANDNWIDEPYTHADFERLQTEVFKVGFFPSKKDREAHAADKTSVEGRRSGAAGLGSTRYVVCVHCSILQFPFFFFAVPQC